MHGTFVNGNKIASDKNHTIKSGDVVTFGASVTRGNGKLDCAVAACNASQSRLMLIRMMNQDTFNALKLRCEYEWFDDRYVVSI